MSFVIFLIQGLLNRVKLGSNQAENSQRAWVFDQCVKFIQIIKTPYRQKQRL